MSRRRSTAPGRWQEVEVLEYKNEGSAPFRDVTRQVLFQHPELAAQLRYFEIEAGGYSTLERHAHLHGVLVLRGRGSCLVGEQVMDVVAHDLVTVPAMAWHQFQASAGETLGFLCLVNSERDRPMLPTDEDLAQLRGLPRVAAYIKP